jgi:hypothetical protein
MTPNYTSYLSGRIYRRQTKSYRTAVSKGDLDILSQNFISTSRRAYFIKFQSCKATISPQKDLVCLARARALKSQTGRMVSSTPVPRAIPHEELLPTLQRDCFSERVARPLQREPGFDDLRYRAHQICFVDHFARETTGQELSVSQLARAFGCYPTRVKSALANEFEEPKRRGRHMAFDDDSEGEILT